MGACSGPDSEYRDPPRVCRHVRRCKFETGRKPVSAEFPDELPQNFAANVSDEPVVHATDGGLATVQDVVRTDAQAEADGLPGTIGIHTVCR